MSPTQPGVIHLTAKGQKQAASNLRVTLAPSPAGPSLVFTGSRQPNCQYRILQADRLTSPVSWSDMGLGWINPDPGLTWFTRREHYRSRSN